MNDLFRAFATEDDAVVVVADEGGAVGDGGGDTGDGDGANSVSGNDSEDAASDMSD